MGVHLNRIYTRSGDTVTSGQALLIIEAMKMETAIAAPQAGTVKAVLAAATTERAALSEEGPIKDWRRRCAGMPIESN